MLNFAMSEFSKTKSSDYSVGLTSDSYKVLKEEIEQKSNRLARQA